MTRTLPLLLLLAGAARAEGPAKVDPREALKPFQGLVAPWKETGWPAGSREEKQKNFWTTLVTWQWQFRDGDVALVAKAEAGKVFTRAELRPSANNRYQLVVELKDEKRVFEGEFKNDRLTVERVDEKTKETQRFLIRFLHSNRITYTYDVKPDGKTMFVSKYEVGWTNQNEPFANSG